MNSDELSTAAVYEPASDLVKTFANCAELACARNHAPTILHDAQKAEHKFAADLPPRLYSVDSINSHCLNPETKAAANLSSQW